ncbi:hypothetical protein B0A48_17640 [Cryoendolithus antarcticus]|uniref:Mitochondrial carrier n=1 Tax=Cryoendolithus antarcticus TaxID=1507870 RepID=A0A1V8SB03_9PEZI|nr:hypothetical protein B0A48_17640 [Cryoendolithus antarcticus]
MASSERGDFAYNSDLDAFTLYHQQVNSSAPSSSTSSIAPALPALGHAIAGSTATAISKLLIYPLDLVITRLQVQHTLHGPRETPSAAKDADAEYSSLADAIRKIYANEGGSAAFYTGCTPDVAKGFADSFLFFLAYTFLRQREQRRHGQVSVPRELGVGIAAGAFAKLITTPLQNVITRQQTAAMVAARSPEKASSTDQTVTAIARQIRSERGLQGFWAGYSASIILTLNPSLTFAVDNLLHRLLLQKSSRADPSAWVRFLIAAMSKVVATSITYPVSLAKSRAQVSASTTIVPAEGTEKGGRTNATRHPSTIASRLLSLLSAQHAILVSLRRIYREEGKSGLYAGLEAEVIKGFLSHGLTMAMKDRIHTGVVQLYYVLLKLIWRWPGELGRVREKVGEAIVDAKQGAGNLVETAKEQVPSVVQVQAITGQVATSVKERAKQTIEGVQARTGSPQELRAEAASAVDVAKEEASGALGIATSAATELAQESQRRVGEAAQRAGEGISNVGAGVAERAKGTRQ